jgi:predicted nucleic acid-binding protein
MRPVFVDSFYFFAILNPADAAHLQAVEYSRRHAAPLLTTTWVIAEIADGLARTANRGVVKRLVSSFRSVSANEIAATTDDVFERGLDLYHARADKHWSLTDCISFVVMEDRGIRDALTGDHHYEQAGFTALLKG